MNFPVRLKPLERKRPLVRRRIVSGEKDPHKLDRRPSCLVEEHWEQKDEAKESTTCGRRGGLETVSPAGISGEVHLSSSIA